MDTPNPTPTRNPARAALDFLVYYPQIGDIADAELREQTLDVLNELWSMSEWKSLEEIPTSSEIPYPNLPHTQCVVELSLAIADTFTKYHGLKINRDYLIAASVLQDASKLVEYSPGTPEKPLITNEIRKWFPHSYWCAHLATLRGLPMEIIHIIVTHSPGSAQFPQTLEGKILYYADQLDVIAIHKDRWQKNLVITK
jgi:hypothetical protein